MELNFRITGEAGRPALVILHGLLGSSRNWISVARRLGDEDFQVYSADLRNHGMSPHDDVMDFSALVADLAEFLDLHGLEQAHLLGHSLGGKVAMRFAMEHPARVLSLVVADIAPRDYGLHFKDDFEAMLALDLGSIENRKQADEALAEAVPDWAHRQFLLTNLQRDQEGRYYWAVNLRALADSLPEIRKNPLLPGQTFDGPVLFACGAKSDFVRPEDRAAIQTYFPRARVQSIHGAGHNLHVDNSEDFNDALRRFYVGL